MPDIDNDILQRLTSHPLQSSAEISAGLGDTYSYATVKRALSKLTVNNLLLTEGKGKATKYRLSPAYQLLSSIDMEAYFRQEQDERQIRDGFNLLLIPEVLTTARLFTATEQDHLDQLDVQFKSNIQQLSRSAYTSEMERLAIDLSWKSSQIEGNTYSLLETERLLKEQQTAAGKPKDDATMLLNHKEAINFITDHPDYVVPLTIRGIEDIHTILVKDLNIDRNVRNRRVGISGTNYKPLDNEHQIREALSAMCTLINNKGNVFEKSLLALVLLSYIQAFNDGNKRTARIVSNAVLIAHHYCPISFRTVDSIEYKKAMLVFYEQNNIRPFKQIFITQYEFAVKTYF